jgi:outer membrane protein assembly factor BamB
MKKEKNKRKPSELTINIYLIMAFIVGGVVASFLILSNTSTIIQRECKNSTIPEWNDHQIYLARSPTIFHADLETPYDFLEPGFFRQNIRYADLPVITPENFSQLKLLARIRVFANTVDLVRPDLILMRWAGLGLYDFNSGITTCISVNDRTGPIFYTLDNNTVVVATDFQLLFFDLTTRSTHIASRPRDNTFSKGAFLANGQEFQALYDDGYLDTFNVTTGQLVGRQRSTTTDAIETATTLTTIPPPLMNNGSVAITLSESANDTFFSGDVIFTDVASGQEIYRVSSHGLGQIQFNSDGTLLLVTMPHYLVIFGVDQNAAVPTPIP